MKERWILKNKAGDFRAIAKQFNISEHIAKIMVNRGHVESEDIDRYLHSSTDQMHDPSLLKDMDKAIELLKDVQKNDELIAISSDYDCDGIFSAYILQEGFREVGIRNHIFIPHRIEEGYGMNKRIVDNAIELGASTIITCDNGIAAYEAIDYAKQQGIKVIVTDHHDIQGDLPNADAVIDPKREDCPYPFKGLCGAGVAFKVIHALIKKLPMQLLPFAAIATVADVMELVDENRIIVKEGLVQLPKLSHCGLNAILAATELVGKPLTPYHIGFVIGPCFNATGRLSSADMAIKLLNENEPTKASNLADQLVTLNNERKSMTLEGTEKALMLCEQNHIIEKDVHLIYLPGCHESLVGIIAGRIREKYNHPVIVFTDAEEAGMIKGSGRSIPAYDMFTELLSCKDLFTHFGGHKMAAGMTLKKEDFDVLDDRLNQHSQLVETDFLPEVCIDLAPPLSYLTPERIKALDVLAPFGHGNEKPIFALQHFNIKKAIRRGANKQVLSLNLVADGTTISGVFFGDCEEFDNFIREEFGEDELQLMYKGLPNSIDVGFTYFPSINAYNGFENTQIQVTHYCRIERRSK